MLNRKATGKVRLVDAVAYGVVEKRVDNSKPGEGLGFARDRRADSGRELREGLSATAREHFNEN
jgi:hypothetical protein